MVEGLIRTLVDKRIGYIHDGNRELLDETYELSLRNEFNWHDYVWYLQLIECGFGADTQRYVISPMTADTPLPFAGLVAFPWLPEFVVTLTSVRQRRICWFVRLRDGVPKVVMPAFDGHVGDAVARGQHVPADALAFMEPDSTRVFVFDEDAFAHELGSRICLELNQVQRQLKYDTIRALGIECYPWSGLLCLCILTDREAFSESDDDAKWSMSEWRYFDFTSTPNANWPYARDLIEQMEAFYQEAPEDEQPQRAESIFRGSAKALCSSAVKEAIEHCGFKLADDFECGVFDPEDADKGNFCEFVQ